MFHDSQLDRTTNGKGLIKFQPYYGGLDQIRTKQAPHQSIPTFKDAMELLMKEGNRHVVFNIDVSFRPLLPNFSLTARQSGWWADLVFFGNRLRFSLFTGQSGQRP